MRFVYSSGMDVSLHGLSVLLRNRSSVEVHLSNVSVLSDLPSHSLESNCCNLDTDVEHVEVSVCQSPSNKLGIRCQARGCNVDM